MRVDYTLPSLEPEPLTETSPETSSEGAPRSFRQELRGQLIQLPASWQRQLRLDLRPFTATYIAPPPRPRSLEVKDADTERSRWRQILSSHRQDLEDSGSPNGSSSHDSVRMMLRLLQDLQDSEDSILSRSAALTRG